MQIVALDGYTLNPGDNPWEEVARLGELTVHDRTPPDQVVERARSAEVILTNKTPVTAEALEQLPGLRFISVLATGYNNPPFVASYEALKSDSSWQLFDLPCHHDVMVEMPEELAGILLAVA